MDAMTDMERRQLKALVEWANEGWVPGFKEVAARHGLSPAPATEKPNTCAHREWVYTPDPSGNNDTGHTCTACGKELTPAERAKSTQKRETFAVPAPAPVQAKGLRFGAEIVLCNDGTFRPALPDGRWLYSSGQDWSGTLLRASATTGGFGTRDAALAALNAAPPPPGWVEPAPAPPPAPPPTERTRWFRSNYDGSVREFPSLRWWRENSDGAPASTATISSLEECIKDGDTELDGPPPHGKPIGTKPEQSQSNAIPGKLSPPPDQPRDAALNAAPPPPGWVEPAPAAPKPEQGGDGMDVPRDSIDERVDAVFGGSPVTSMLYSQRRKIAAHARAEVTRARAADAATIAALTKERDLWKRSSDAHWDRANKLAAAMTDAAKSKPQLKAAAKRARRAARGKGAKR